MTQSDTIGELAKALIAFQGEMPSVGKNADNPFFKSKYADLASIVKVAAPILGMHDLAVSQMPTHLMDDGKVVPALKTTLVHASGEFMSETTPLLLVKQDSQSQGSATTYLRRYSYQGTLGIVADVDDDGNAASTPTASVPSARPPAAAPSLKDKVGAAAGRTSPDVPTGSPDEIAATTPQQGKIYAEANRLGWTDDDTASYITSILGIAVEKSGRNWPITKRQATRLIDAMVKGEGMDDGEPALTGVGGDVEESPPF